MVSEGKLAHEEIQYCYGEVQMQVNNFHTVPHSRVSRVALPHLLSDTGITWLCVQSQAGEAQGTQPCCTSPVQHTLIFLKQNDVF